MSNASPIDSHLARSSATGCKKPKMERDDEQLERPRSGLWLADDDEYIYSQFFTLCL
jgi:hypothetical protein